MLSLLPRPSSSPISVSLHHKSERDSKGTYEALSYLRGIPNDKVSGIWSGIELLVTVNLFVGITNTYSKDVPIVADKTFKST